MPDTEANGIGHALVNPGFKIGSISAARMNIHTKMVFPERISEIIL